MLAATVRKEIVVQVGLADARPDKSARVLVEAAKQLLEVQVDLVLSKWILWLGYG